MHDLPLSLRRSVLVLGAVLVLTQASGCNDVHVGSPTGPAVFSELEPNDDPISADFVASLDDRSFLAVQGRVDAIGFDVVDHIEFETVEPLELDFSLLALTPGGDLDVRIYDPVSNQILGSYTSSGDEEFGTIIVHEPFRPFQFVIEAYGVDSEWDLEIRAYPYDCGCLRTADQAGDDVQSLDAEATPWIQLEGADVDSSDDENGEQFEGADLVQLDAEQSAGALDAQIGSL
ncbi:MAG: hypothetical protein AAFR54_21755 [Planctomycetota bacterium]